MQKLREEIINRWGTLEKGAYHIGITVGTLSTILNGHNRPSRTTICRIEAALGMDWAELQGAKDVQLLAK